MDDFPKNSGHKEPKKGASFIYVLLFALILTVAYYVFNPQSKLIKEKGVSEIPISQLVNDYNGSKYTAIEIKDNRIFAVDADKNKFMAFRPTGETIAGLGLNNSKVPTTVTVINTETTAFWMSAVSNWLPIILFIALIVFMAKQLSKGAGNALSFGKTQARLYSKKDKRPPLKMLQEWRNLKKNWLKLLIS